MVSNPKRAIFYNVFSNSLRCSSIFRYIQTHRLCVQLFQKRETPAFYPVLHPVFHENTGSVLTKSLKSRAPASGEPARPNVLSVSLFSSCPSVFHLVREMHAVTAKPVTACPISNPPHPPPTTDNNHQPRPDRRNHIWSAGSAECSQSKKQHVSADAGARRETAQQ